jgi:hypothetical protein
MIPRQLSPRNDEGTTAPHCIHSECTRIHARGWRGLKLLFILYILYYVVIKFVAVVPPSPASPVTHDAKKWKTIPLLSLPWDFRDADTVAVLYSRKYIVCVFGPTSAQILYPYINTLYVIMSYNHREYI